MRLFHITRLIDKTTAFKKDEIHQITSGFFGAKFNQKQDLINKEQSEEKLNV